MSEEYTKKKNTHSCCSGPPLQLFRTWNKMAAPTVLRKDTWESGIRWEGAKTKTWQSVWVNLFWSWLFCSHTKVFSLPCRIHINRVIGGGRSSRSTAKIWNTTTALHHLVYRIAIVLIIMIIMVIMITSFSFICHLMMNTLNDQYVT